MIISDVKEIMLQSRTQALISKEEVLNKYVTHKKEKLVGVKSQLMICFGHQSDIESPYIIVDMMEYPFNIATLVGYISRQTYVDLKKEYASVWSSDSNVDMYAFNPSVMKRHEIKFKMRETFG